MGLFATEETGVDRAVDGVEGSATLGTSGTAGGGMVNASSRS